MELKVHGANLFLTDTLIADTDEVVQVTDLAMFDPGLGRCTSYAPGGAAADWEPQGQKLVRIELDPPTGPGDVELYLISVFKPEPEGARYRLACGDEVDQPFAVTSLGGLGPPLSGPVDHCLDFGCSRSTPILVHQPLAPVLTASFTDLRPEAISTDSFLTFRLDLDRRVEGLIPILVLGSGEEIALGAMEEYEDGSYRWGINRDPKLPSDSLVRLYLIRR